MTTSRTPHAMAHAPSGHGPSDRLVASRDTRRAGGPRARAHLRLVPELPAPAAPAVSAMPPAPAARPRRPVPQRPVPQRPVRLTRRGRVVVVLFLATVLVVTGWFVSRAVAGAATTHPPSGPSVVARPGDTLWSIALRARPRTDPRVTVDRIIDANHLASPVIQPGQRLVLPPS